MQDFANVEENLLLLFFMFLDESGCRALLLSKNQVKKKVQLHFGLETEFKLGHIIQQKYRICKILSSGRSSRCYKCYDLETNTKVVIKLSKKQKQRELKLEAQVLQMLSRFDPDGAYFIHLYDFFEIQGHQCLVLEYIGPDLFTIKEDIPNLGILIIKQIGYQIAQAIWKLHLNGFIHTDIKPENIVVSENILLKHVLPNQIRAKLIDFDAIQYGEKYHSILSTTRHFRAPEIMMALNWSYEIDVWSYGCVLLELALQRIPFDRSEDIHHLFAIQHQIGPFSPWMFEQSPVLAFRRIVTDNIIRPDAIEAEFVQEDLEMPALSDELNFDVEFKDLVLSCLKPDPIDRITMRQVINHPFFSNIK